jgi:DNA-binding IclR family transcriptional regulator
MPGIAGISIPYYDSFNELVFAFTITTTSERLTDSKSQKFVAIIRSNAEKAGFINIECNPSIFDREDQKILHE